MINQKLIRNSLGFFSALTISLIMLSCGKNDEPNLSKSRSSFQDAIEDFDKQKNDVSEAINKGKESLITLKETIKTAKNKDKQFKKVHDKWEDVEKDVNKLKGKFEILVKGADDYYLSLENLSLTINNESFREKSRNELNESKEKYTERLKATKEKLGDLDRLYNKVYDVMTSLEITYSLDVFEEEMTKTFDEIDTMVESIMTELDSLLKESKELLDSKQS